MELEASVSVDIPLEPGRLTHEVLVSKGGVFTFYRNGVQMASVPSPRAVTDCDGDVVLLGSSSLALSSVSFYARAFQANEVAEMYVGGQPLSELATGSVLPLLSIASSEQVIGQIVSSADQNGDVIGKVKDQTVFNTVLSMASSEESTLSLEENIIFHPPDNADATVLPSSLRGSLLPKYGQLLWGKGGEQNATTENMRKSSRAWRNDTSQKSYYPIVQGPVFTDSSIPDLVHDFPFEIPDNAPGLTISGWFQPLRVDRSDSFGFSFFGGKCEVPNSECLEIRYYDQGGWLSAEIKRNSNNDAEVGSGGGIWNEDDPEQSSPDEMFINTRRSGEMGPGAWRMVTVQVDLAAKALRFFKDGIQVADSTKGFNMDPTWNDPISDKYNISWFSFGQVTYRNGVSDQMEDSIDGSPDVSATFRVTDMRIYPNVLTRQEIAKIHTDSTWRQGGKIRQVGVGCCFVQ